FVTGIAASPYLFSACFERIAQRFQARCQSKPVLELADAGATRDHVKTGPLRIDRLNRYHQRHAVWPIDHDDLPARLDVTAVAVFERLDLLCHRVSRTLDVYAAHGRPALLGS